MNGQRRIIVKPHPASPPSRLRPRDRSATGNCGSCRSPAFSGRGEIRKPDMPFASIPEAVHDVKRGRLVIVVDDPDRENEGDLICAASKATPELVNFMAKYGRGLICLPIVGGQLDKLRVSPMVENSQE